MGKRKKKSTKRAKKESPGEAGDRADRRERVAQRKGKGADSRQESWLAAKRPVLRFVLVFAVLIGAFNVYFYVWFSKSEAFESYLHFNAQVSGAILRVFGESACVAETSITSPRFALNIKRGCDAIQASVFFVFLVLASPLRTPLLKRLPAIIVGMALLLLINLVRIISLYYIGVYVPSAFKTMHVEIWQALFIFLPLFLWVLWVRRAMRPSVVACDV